MAVTNETQQRLSPTLWLFRWDGTALFYVYYEGILAHTLTRNWLQVDCAPGEQLQVEVLDDPETAPQPGYPGRGMLHWSSVDDAMEYRIEEWVTDAWVLRERVSANGASVYLRQTRFLEDDTEHQFRVVPVHTNGADGTPRYFTFYMVRRPDVVEWTGSYSALTGDLTVTVT